MLGHPEKRWMGTVDRGEGQPSPQAGNFGWASLVAQTVKNLPAMWETWVWSLGWEDLLEKEKATPSSNLAWRIPWSVLSMGLQRVRHDWAIFTTWGSFLLSLFIWGIGQKSSFRHFCQDRLIKKNLKALSLLWHSTSLHSKSYLSSFHLSQNP